MTERIAPTEEYIQPELSPEQWLFLRENVDDNKLQKYFEAVDAGLLNLSKKTRRQYLGARDWHKVHEAMFGIMGLTGFHPMNMLRDIIRPSVRKTAHDISTFSLHESYDYVTLDDALYEVTKVTTSVSVKVYQDTAKHSYEDRLDWYKSDNSWHFIHTKLTYHAPPGDGMIHMPPLQGDITSEVTDMGVAPQRHIQPLLHHYFLLPDEVKNPLQSSAADLEQILRNVVSTDAVRSRVFQKLTNQKSTMRKDQIMGWEKPIPQAT